MISIEKNKDLERPLTLYWFRQDFNLGQNFAFQEACKSSHSVFAFYIFPEETKKHLVYGEASLNRLYYSLKNLQENLQGKLHFFQGSTQRIFLHLLKNHKIKACFYNNCFEPFRRKEEVILQRLSKDYNFILQSYNSCYLTHPKDIKNKKGDIYKVFTPYKQAVLEKIQHLPFKSIIDKTKISSLVHYREEGVSLESLCLIKEQSWEKKLQPYSEKEAGELKAQEKFFSFFNNDLGTYEEKRNVPSYEKGTSGLSKALHFGEISPHFLFQELQKSHGEKTKGTSSLALNSQEKFLQSRDIFLSELCWREFGAYLLYHFPSSPQESLRKKFDHFPWSSNKNHLKKWQQGETGYPFVDAGMRELWATGAMHNRLRMVTASFLVKNLHIHWKEGEQWFWHCLLDADEGSNVMNWQWVAGCGVDAAPYFRIFNPTLQGEKFDPEGLYTKKWVPELKDLPAAYLYKPWTAPQDLLKEKSIILGKTYPYPLVDFRRSSQEALEKYKNL